MRSIDEIFEEMKEKYGPINMPVNMDDNEVRLLKLEARNNLARDYTIFRKRPSATNWHKLTKSMAIYQYWFHKPILDGVEE